VTPQRFGYAAVQCGATFSKLILPDFEISGSEYRERSSS
jgi:hypothetical protein